MSLLSTSRLAASRKKRSNFDTAITLTRDLLFAPFVRSSGRASSAGRDERAFDRCAERFGSEAPGVAPAVDEERRCTGHAARHAGIDVTLDPRGNRLGVRVGGELVEVEIERLGVEQQAPRLERVLMGEQRVVHGPEPALDA